VQQGEEEEERQEEQHPDFVLATASVIAAPSLAGVIDALLGVAPPEGELSEPELRLDKNPFAARWITLAASSSLKTWIAAGEDVPG